MIKAHSMLHMVPWMYNTKQHCFMILTSNVNEYMNHVQLNTRDAATWNSLEITNLDVLPNH